MTVVRVYLAPRCHLCEAALEVIERVRAGVEFELELVDVSADPELEVRYRERLPVVEVDGVEAFTYFVHDDALRERVGG